MRSSGTSSLLPCMHMSLIPSVTSYDLQIGLVLFLGSVATLVRWAQEKHLSLRWLVVKDV